MTTPIEYAQLDWDAPDDHQGAPRSSLFDDIYFAADGPAETTHVFLDGNDLAERMIEAARFSIGEIGFGTGLNILCAWRLWNETTKPVGARLHFLSVEKHPLAPADLERAHQAWPELAELSATLRAVMPAPYPGPHHLQLAEDVSLTLYLGEAASCFKTAEAQIDAWFLDGFAPSKNPDLWGEELISDVARLSAPQASFATFTVAGAVRRGLQSAGFALERRPGFGRKREMLTGRLTQTEPRRAPRAPWFVAANTRTLNEDARIAIIGAGIAGASLAYALRTHGYAPTVFDGKGPASGASGNPAGLIMPRLDLGDTPTGRFHALAYLHTLRLLDTLPDNVFTPCGIHRLNASDKEAARHQRLRDEHALPVGWIDGDENGLFFPQAGVVDPGAFVRALISDTPVINEAIERLDHKGGEWCIQSDKGEHGFDTVIIANALGALRFAQMRSLPLTGSAGQIDYFPDAPAPDGAYAFGPYGGPAPGGGLVIGATYAPIAIGDEPAFSPEATASNLAAVAAVKPELVAGLTAGMSTPRVSVRCTTPDRLPVAGAVPDWGFYAGAYDGLRTGKRADYPAGQAVPGLYALTGLGSRGLVTAPLCAAMIAAEIAGAPAPVSADIAGALHPARFFIRDLKRGR